MLPRGRTRPPAAAMSHFCHTTGMTDRIVLFMSLGVMAAVGGCASEPLEGAWRSRVQFSSGDFAPVKDLEFLYVFNRGGTMTESSNYDSLPPSPPAYGVWR